VDTVDEVLAIALLDPTPRVSGARARVSGETRRPEVRP